MSTAEYRYEPLNINMSLAEYKCEPLNIKMSTPEYKCELLISKCHPLNICESLNINLNRE